jgi:hypothetical protein
MPLFLFSYSHHTHRSRRFAITSQKVHKQQAAFPKWQRSAELKEYCESKATYCDAMVRSIHYPEEVYRATWLTQKYVMETIEET